MKQPMTFSYIPIEGKNDIWKQFNGMPIFTITEDEVAKALDESKTRYYSVDYGRTITVEEFQARELLSLLNKRGMVS